MVLNNSQIEELFDEEQIKGWGARGNPYLWREIKQRFLSDNKNLGNEVDFFEYFFDIFIQLTGVDIGEFDTKQIERYMIGSGISDGIITSEFWNWAVLQMKDRFMEILQNSENQAIKEP